MPEQGKADEVATEQRTDELSTQSAEPANADEGTEATGGTSDSLNYDELLGKKDPHNKRGGLSRKEARQQNEDVEPSEIEKLREELDEIRSMTSSSKAESAFEKALDGAEVNVSTFNSDYKADYLSKFEALQKDGLSVDRASKYALDMVLPKVQADQAESRSNARVRSALPPTGKTQSKTVYKQSEIDKLATTDKSKYKQLMNERDKGKITIM